MRMEFRPHDLLWLANGAARKFRPLSGVLPAWAGHSLQCGHPVVVRRACAPRGQIAVGVRGTSRAERLAGFVCCADVVRYMVPPALRLCAPRASRTGLAVMQAWEDLRGSLDIPYEWGPAGSCAYELATGYDTVSAASDLDLVLYADAPVARNDARELLGKFSHPACRCDVQMMTSLGGLALAEWARGDQRILLKTSQGPVLTEDPWRQQEEPDS